MGTPGISLKQGPGDPILNIWDPWPVNKRAPMILVLINCSAGLFEVRYLK